MKTVILTVAMAFIAFGAFSINNSAMACASCGCSEMKSECNCASKKEHNHAKKPCTVCEKSEKAWNKKHKKHKAHKSMQDHSEKGSLTIRSGSAEGSRYN